MSADIRNTCRPVLILSLLAALSACGDAPQSTSSSGTEIAAVSAPTVAPAAKEETAAELMRRANAAFREDRIVDPSGDNATELFLALRDRDPNHPGLADALVEIMPLAQFAFEAAVRNQDLAEAERLHALIARIDADSAITRSAENRIAGLRASLSMEQAAAERVAASAAAAATAQAAERVAEANTRPAAKPNEATAPAAAATKPTVVPTAAVAAAEPVAVREPASSPAVAAATRPALSAPQPISKVAPDYPPQARSRKIEGFVELEFRVAANGNTEDIRVVRSEPEGLFDRNAVRALMRWKFKPAERNGVPEATTTRTTMNFRQS